MDFTKFPWDEQQLLVEIRYVHNRGKGAAERRWHADPAAAPRNLQKLQFDSDPVPLHCGGCRYYQCAAAERARVLKLRAPLQRLLN